MSGYDGGVAPDCKSGTSETQKVRILPHPPNLLAIVPARSYAGLTSKEAKTETDDIPTAAVSNWQPITDKLQLAVLGKLGEEVNELGARLARAIIQGLDGADPETGKTNREAIEDEIADVLAMVDHVFFYLGLDSKRVNERALRKHLFKSPWFEALRDQEGR